MVDKETIESEIKHYLFIEDETINKLNQLRGKLLELKRREVKNV